MLSHAQIHIVALEKVIFGPFVPLSLRICYISGNFKKTQNYLFTLFSKLILCLYVIICLRVALYYEHFTKINLTWSHMTSECRVFCVIRTRLRQEVRRFRQLSGFIYIYIITTIKQIGKQQNRYYFWHGKKEDNRTGYELLRHVVVK